MQIESRKNLVFAIRDAPESRLESEETKAKTFARQRGFGRAKSKMIAKQTGCQ